MSRENKFDFICKRPFVEQNLSLDGHLYPCCEIWTNRYSFGNVFEQDAKSIINSEEAREFRRSILNKSYKYCNTEFCLPIRADEKKIKLLCREDGTSEQLCEHFSFCHDKVCNLKCIICRDEYKTNSIEETQKLDSIIDTVLPLLKNAKIVSINGQGELFASRHSRNLVKQISSTYPDIKFDILSNGLLFDEKNCNEIGILNKIVSATISVHSNNKKTYDKIMLGSNYKQVWKNIEWLCDQKAKNKIKTIKLAFVISLLNYKEMKNFLKKAIEMDIEVLFALYNTSDSNMAYNYHEMAVWEPENKKHKDFVKIISDPIFDTPKCVWPKIIEDLRKEPSKTFFDLSNFLKR